MTRIKQVFYLSHNMISQFFDFQKQCSNISHNIIILVGHSACSSGERRVIQNHHLHKVIYTNEYKDALEDYEKTQLELKEIIEVLKNCGKGKLEKTLFNVSECFPNKHH